MDKIIFIGLGGALGAICRYLLSLIPYKGDFPYMTLLTNLLGAILIGVVVGMAGKNKEMSKNLTLFLKTGFCGGFTTFSTFSLETLSLFESHRMITGTLYAVVSVVLCVLGVWIGLFVVDR